MQEARGNWETLIIKGGFNMGRLAPGTVGRRYVPEGGLQRHRDRIHRESKQYDNMNLPFTFSKPMRSGKSIVVECTNCGHITSAPKNTIGIICNWCSKYSSVKEVRESG